MSKTGLVLEGGAMRSVFTAGVLDYFLEEEVHIQNIYTLSAGAYAALNYISEQPQRSVKTNIEPFQKKGYAGFKTFLRTGNFFDMKLLFEEMPHGEYPYNFKNFFDSTKKLIMSTTNCLTGEAIYYDEYSNQKELMDICRASNSMPFVCRIVDVDGVPMLDGGMVDAIPVNKAIDMGIEKMVIVFTQKKGYRKKSYPGWYQKMIEIVYRKYPQFVHIMSDRVQRYNNTLDKIEELIEEGKVYGIYPTLPPVKNHETNHEKLMQFYQHGYESAKEKALEVKQFLEI